MGESIGRFEIIKELGHGAQGTVWLAQDPVLDRQIALKELRCGNVSLANRDALLNEARLVSQLHHPNVVSVFDLIEHQGEPVLVFEYVEGIALDARLKRTGYLPIASVVSILQDILSGLAAAHDKGIVHRDIKPANVMLDAQGRARLMDFGIASILGQTVPAKLAGTVEYMAPEYLAGKEASVAGDLFSVGMLAYELLTGTNPAAGDHPFAVLNRIAHITFPPPSSLVADLPEQLEHIILVALNKNPTERYLSADEMLRAIAAYLKPVTSESALTGMTTLDFLIRRIKHTKGFPALSSSISTINKLITADAENIQKLAETILRDFALTNSMLRIVNSVSYGQFGGTISTISRAIMIIGFDTVRNLAISLILFEHMQNRNQATSLREQMMLTFLSGLLSRAIAKKMGVYAYEESFIGGMFFSLGKLLAAYYLHDEYLQIQADIRQGGNETTASTHVLGISYTELGIGIARDWHYPDRLLHAVQRLEGHVPKSKKEVEQLRIAANLAGDLTAFAADTTPADREKILANLAGRFQEATGLNTKDMLNLLQTGLLEFDANARHFGIDPSQGDTMSRLHLWAGISATKPAAGDALENQSLAANQAAMAEATSDRIDAQAIMSAGIQDITNTLVSDYKLGDLVNMILEAMYRGMGFQRVLFCMKDPKHPQLIARFGYAYDRDKMLKSFCVPLEAHDDVFQLALNKNLDIQIDDANAPNIADRIPAWYRSLVGAQAFLLLPVMVDKRVVGLFYLDQQHAGTLNLNPKALTLLKTLRNQAVLGIRQKQLG